MMQSLATFFDMGGHGLYVWSAWGIAIAIIALMAVAPRIRWRAFKRRLQAERELAMQHEDEALEEGVVGQVGEARRTAGQDAGEERD